VTSTPLLTATGTSRADPSFKLPPELAPVLKTGFEILPSDPPEIVTLPKDQGYAMVSPGETVPAAPAPLATVHDQVANDWINSKAAERARTAAQQVEAKVEKGMPLAQAIKEANAAGAQVRPVAARRIQIASAQGPVAEPLKMLFSLASGKSRMIPDASGRGYYVVHVTKVVPGNAALQPSLIAQVQNELQQGVSDDYAREFITAMQQELKAKRNDSAIAAMKARLASSGG
jgi:peptidyl-prolyl cis-trans isomerase D